MSLVKKKITVETDTLNARITKDLYARLEQYCAFVGRSWEERHEVVGVLLAYALDHDKEFSDQAKPGGASEDLLTRPDGHRARRAAIRRNPKAQPIVAGDSA